MPNSWQHIPMRIITASLLAVTGVLVWQGFMPAYAKPSPPSAPPSHAQPASGTCSADATHDIAYLLFWPPLPGTNTSSTSEQYIQSIKDFARKLGTTGDGKTRQLAFGASIPVLVHDESQIPRAIKMAFDIARQNNVAVHFAVDDHIVWEERPDLWNWYDPQAPGYNPENAGNVEWYDWEGTANKRRYFTPLGVPAKTPHMCYNSPGVRKEITRIVSEVIGPALRGEIQKLKQENKAYLFAGLTVGAEAGFDDYSVLPSLSEIRLHQAVESIGGIFSPASEAKKAQSREIDAFKHLAQMMDEDGAPHSPLGYCYLTHAGYSKAHPPADFHRAIVDANREFIAFWDKLFVDAGVPCSRVYTHVAATPAQDAKNNAPIEVVFNPYSRPGWTTYPQYTLGGGLQPLYEALAKHGNPVWAGVEANAFGSPYALEGMSWEKYLAWHYNHGAKLVGVNVGAMDPSLMENLTKGAYGDVALETYRKFLRGEKLSEQ